MAEVLAASGKKFGRLGFSSVFALVDVLRYSAKKAEQKKLQNLRKKIFDLFFRLSVC